MFVYYAGLILRVAVHSRGFERKIQDEERLVRKDRRDQIFTLYICNTCS